MKCDQKGREINDDDLRRAWKQTIEPGLNYLKKHSTKPPTGNAIPAHPSGNGQPAKPKRQLEGKSAAVKNKKKGD